MRQARQGDVFQEAGEIPADAVPCKPRNGRYILADGEATGHHHSVAVADDIQMFERNGVLFLRSGSGCVIEHQEHGPISLDAGDYRIERQREYTPERIRNVAD